MKNLIGNAVVIKSRFRSKENVFVVTKSTGNFVYLIRCNVDDNSVEPFNEPSGVIRVANNDFESRFREVVFSRFSVGFGTPFVSIYALDNILKITDKSISKNLYSRFGD